MYLYEKVQQVKYCKYKLLISKQYAIYSTTPMTSHHLFICITFCIIRQARQAVFSIKIHFWRHEKLYICLKCQSKMETKIRKIILKMRKSKKSTFNKISHSKISFSLKKKHRKLSSIYSERNFIATNCKLLYTFNCKISINLKVYFQYRTRQYDLAILPNKVSQGCLLRI